MRRSGVRFLATGAAVVALVLAGCSEDGEAEPRKPDSSSAAATPTPTPTGPVEPTLPPEAQGEDAAAAEAFVRHYWAVVNYAQESGDVRALRRLAAPSCAACRGGADGVRRIANAGGSTVGGTVTVKSVKAEPYAAGPLRGYVVNVVTDISAQTVRVPGEAPKRYAGGPATFQFVVDPSDAGWRVARWDRT